MSRPQLTSTGPPSRRPLGSRNAARVLNFVAASTVAMLCLASPARADQIDGDWCHDDGRRFSIRGPMIVTPGGAMLSGNYTRHSFQYTVPPSEADSGASVFMTLRSETRVDVRVNGPSETFQVWHRCTATTS
jgi:hypothetical protein